MSHTARDRVTPSSYPRLGVNNDGQYAVLIADVHGPVTLAPDAIGTPRFVPARNALVPGMSASALDLGPTLWVFPPSSPAEVAVAAELGERAMEGVDSVTTDFALLDLTPETRSGHQRAFTLSLWPVFSLTEDESAHAGVASVDADWSAYRSMNGRFARLIREHAALGARVMVRDLELLLVAGMLREQRPDLSISFFSFAPWCSANALTTLPAQVAGAIIDSLAACDDVGFLSEGSVQRFRDTMRAHHAVSTPKSAHFQLPIDSAEISEKAFSPATQGVVGQFQTEYASLALIARAERAERSANLVGGLRAFQRLLTSYPQWQGRVVHVNAIFPGSLDPSGPEMLTEAEKLADNINLEFATESWRPVEFSGDIDYIRSLALMRAADVYVGNPTLESMSITTWEAIELNERPAAFVFSSTTGVAELFPGEALIVDANDIDATARALHEALLTSEQFRSERLARMRAKVRMWTPAEWFAAQLSN